jgi:uncharacterized protein
MTLPILPNPTARRIFLHRHALAEAPTGPAKGEGLADLIQRIGFVQVDSITTVERAHHMILFARRQSYKPESLKPLLESNRALFEHWTHDASILPVALFPHWQHRFARDTHRLRDNWKSWFRDGYESKFDEILTRVANHGPVTSTDVGVGEARGKGGWWDWHPSKTALEWLWRTGALSITRRDGFQKVYDLTERVIPVAHRTATPDIYESTNWACNSALNHLGFATPTELAAYWNAVPIADARAWCRVQLAQQTLIEINIQNADGTLRPAYARPEILTESPPEPTTRIRILSPFDPALRDRNRTERLFGFHYRIEVFVPEPKRTYGYYVFPILEGANIIARIDMKSHRDQNTVKIRALWMEKGVKLTQPRRTKLDAELNRMARFSGCDRVEFLDGWER